MQTRNIAKVLALVVCLVVAFVLFVTGSYAATKGETNARVNAAGLIVP